MDARRPVRRRARALAAADRLVVREAVVSEDGVVHRPLPLGGHGNRLGEGVEDDVGDPARRLRVARGDGGRCARVDERALGSAHGHGREGSSRRGQVGCGEAAHDVEAGGPRDGERAVQVALVLGRGALEVDVDRVARDGHGRADVEQAERRLEHVGALEAAVRQLPNRRADDPFRVGEELVHRSRDSVPAPPCAELGDPPLGESVPGQLRAKVAATLVGVPHARDERLERGARRAGSEE